MTLDPQKLRIEGTYEQRQPGYFMQRVKVPGGVLSAEQALKVAEIAERFARGSLHLTSRGSIEFHWVEGRALPEIGRMLASVGLTSRGACGGAVRGIVCSTPFLEGYPSVQVLARKLHHHFTQNPHFEGLPKKFKICVDAGYRESRHLIQDVGLVLAETKDGEECYDVWAAGGLGREPHPAFLLEGSVPEGRIIPLIEAVVTVYRRHTPPGKRLKHLVREKGQDGFRALLQEELAGKEDLYLPDGFGKQLTPPPPEQGVTRIEAGVFAGELAAARLVTLAEIAALHAGGFLVITCDQKVAFHLLSLADQGPAVAALAEAGFGGDAREERVTFRVCPGNHECKMGLAPTRDVARRVLEAMGPAGERKSWAIAGCHNSCSQPQLAEVGIVVSKLVKDENGERHPRFDLYRRSCADGLGIPARQELSLAELLAAAQELA
ncbi:MAG TPA: nitrite/sulfite reductase [Geobacteraceae bacterium]|nr:nitrite/sulfite reductase [Geobacteraceae bacterium]